MKKLHVWLSIVGALFFIIAIISFFLRVFNKIESGKGADYYFTAYGVQFNYFGAGVVIVAIPVTITIALILRWWHNREERDFIKKYSKNDENT